MRWANLSVPTDADDSDTAIPELVTLPGATVRTVDTPEFAGMTFYEIRAKSLINRVPGPSRVPFQWTVNPYRGCSHACSYCLAGETPVLLADGGTRPLSQLVVGDAVYGTVGVGADRRYVPTTVLDHWSTRKAAFRVTLADGTRLVASGDHRFLTTRGWRHVTTGSGDRPALRTGDTLLGVGHFADPPKESPDYQAGYLCGLIRGDAGHRVRGAGATPRPGGADATAWERADRCLEHVPLDHALRWPDEPGDGWRRGFLAGAYAATGDTDGHAVRFTSRDRGFLHRVTEALHHLGIPNHEPTHRPMGAPPVVESAGDLWTALRFRHLTGAAGADLDATGTPVHGDDRLAVASVESLGLTLPLYDITTGTGDFVADGVVSHNCFARHTHTYLDLDAGHDFDSKIVVKVNAGELIRRELAAPRWRGGHIAMGTNVDCYQRAEGRYRLMPEILTALVDHANPFSILTKGTLILRDLSLLTRAATVTDVGVSFSVGFVDEAVWRAVEPGTPSPRRRLDAVRALTDAGFAVDVLMAPILPGLTDTEQSIDETVAAIAASGAAGVTPLVLHLRPGAREWYSAWLRRAHPQLAPHYRELFSDGAYAAPAYQREIGARVRLAARRHGMHRSEPDASRRAAARPTGADSDPRAGERPTAATTVQQLTLL